MQEAKPRILTVRQVGTAAAVGILLPLAGALGGVALAWASTAFAVWVRP